MMMMMKVRIGIVTHNRCDILPKAIDSALAQTWKEKEIVVFDSGSSDATTALRSHYPQVTWERSDANVGYLHARNHLMESSTAELYCSLDDDAWFTRDDELSVAIQLFIEQPRLAAVAFDILSPDRPSPSPRTAAVPTHMFIGCGHVVRIASIRQAGFYTPSPGSYGAEEKDLCLRLLNAGFEILRTPGVHVWHDKSPVSRDQRMQHRSGVCNDLTFALRRIPAPMIWWILPGKILNHLRFSLRHRLLGPCLSGFFMFLRNFRAIARERDPVRAAAVRQFNVRARLTT